MDIRNDVLTYATSGGVGVNRTGNINVASNTDITDPGVLRMPIQLW
jgi:hypothetical protein